MFARAYAHFDAHVKNLMFDCSKKMFEKNLMFV